MTLKKHVLKKWAKKEERSEDNGLEWTLWGGNK